LWVFKFFVEKSLNRRISIGYMANTQDQKGVVYWWIRRAKDGISFRYRALVGDHVVHGVTIGGEPAVMGVVNRMARAEADLLPKLRSMVEAIVDHVVKATEVGVNNVEVAMGAFFHTSEYLEVSVNIRRLAISPTWDSGRWWGVVKAMFKGEDGHKPLSKHVVEYHFESYGAVDRDILYSRTYQAARMAYNAYVWANKP
jgi:septum formation topological specificity factor MinE